MKNIFKPSYLIIAGLVITVILLLSVRGCGGRGEKLKAIAAENKLLKDRVEQDSITRATERIAEKDQLDRQRKETEAAKEDVKADRKLSETQSWAVRMANQLRLQYKTLKPDSAFTDYANNCDTLAAKVIEQDGQINAYKREVDETMELLNYEVVLRDSIIEKETEYSARLKADFNRQSRLLENALTIGRPRGKFLAGAGVIGNQTTFLSGAKIALAYQTKRGKQYLAGGLLMNKTIYYEATVMVPLFK
jgi:hypothetical protein